MMLFFVIARERGQIKPEVRELFCLPPNLGLSVGMGPSTIKDVRGLDKKRR